jgi:hypothetical protein
VRGHDRVDAAGDGRAKGHQLDALEPLARDVQAGQAEVAVFGSVAVSREMFGGHQDRVLRVGMRAGDVGLHEAGHLVGILAVRARVDDGIVGVVVHVGDGREDPLHAEGAGLAGRFGALEANVVQIAAGAEGHVLRPRRGGIHAHGRAALEIGAHQQSGVRASFCRRLRSAAMASGSALWTAAVDGVAEHDDAADAQVLHKVNKVAEVAGARVLQFAEDGRHDQLRRLVAQGESVRPGERCGCGRGPLWAGFRG